MTCIVGLVEDKTVYIGGDSAGVSGISVRSRADRKVFSNGDMIFGFCGSFRMGQLLQYKFSPPEHKRGVGVMAYMVTDFVDSVRECFKDGGLGKIVHSVESAAGSFMIGYRGQLFDIQSDFQVGQNHDSWIASGCGDDYALGAMYASSGENLEPVSRIKMALKCAEHYSGGVAAPFKVVRLNPPS